MKSYPDNHFSAVVTDPPYGLKFMCKAWDHGIPGIDYWKEALRICKPGSFLLAFGGTRTHHRLTCAIEDAGWEIRDCLMWLYGSGFPKSHNHFGIEGYGTALKPAYEPIIMAMKPIDGTFAQNAENWGQAGINIDACRIHSKENLGRLNKIGNNKSPNTMNPGNTTGSGPSKFYNTPIEEQGRWPANLLLDEESAAMLDEQSGISTSRKNKVSDNRYSPGKYCDKENNLKNNRTPENSHNDSGGASRFFYCAKASASERDGSTHPTVKPLKLMEYIIKLVMPPKDGLLLDPFAGSGTTIVAAKRLGYRAEGIEISEEYCEIAKKRVCA